MKEVFHLAANEVISRCETLAAFTEEPGFLTRTFLSDEMKLAYAMTRQWMEEAGMTVRLDSAGNLRGLYGAGSPRIIIGSHLDTVPRGGKYDGILGVVLGIGLVKLLSGKRLPFGIEVIGFSDEEGVRFGVPFIGSKALAGILDLREESGGLNTQIRNAISDFGLDPSDLDSARLAPGSKAFLEFHIEQGPVLEHLDLELGIVNTIVGQSRFELHFKGQANHAGTTPMNLRKDALSGAAEWILEVEKLPHRESNLVATVGRIEARPGAGNVIPGDVIVSLDVRHPQDQNRLEAAGKLLQQAEEICRQRGLTLETRELLNQAAAPMNKDLSEILKTAVEVTGRRAHFMNSGAGHDCMVLAPHLPTAMLFLRSPGGLSHHPDEVVRAQDVAAALEAGLSFVNLLEERGWLGE